jgi:hypothetical protein
VHSSVPPDAVSAQHDRGQSDTAWMPANFDYCSRIVSSCAPPQAAGAHNRLLRVRLSLIFAKAYCPTTSNSRCGMFGSSFGTTTASMIAGPSHVNGSQCSRVCAFRGMIAVNADTDLVLRGQNLNR